MGKRRVGGVCLLAMCASVALSCVVRTTDVRIRTAWERLLLDNALARYYSSGPDEVTPEARAALGKRLEKLSVQELLDLQERHEEVFPKITPGLRWIPPAEIVDMAEHMAHVRTLGSTIDKGALIDNILNRRWGPLLVTVEFQVISSYPPLNEEVINVRGGLHRDDLDRIEEGREWLLALKCSGNVLTPMYSFSAQGMYQVEDGKVYDFVRGAAIAVEEAWNIVRDLYVRIHGPAEQQDAAKAKWLAKLTDGNLEECLTAVEYFSSLPEPVVSAEVLIEAIERQRDELLARLRGEGWYAIPRKGRGFRAFAGKAIDLLAKVADDEAVEHMLKLYTEDLSTPRSALVGLEMPMVRLVLAVPGPKRSERFLHLYETRVESKIKAERRTRFFGRDLIEDKHEAIEALESVEGDDIDDIMLMMVDGPKRFHLLDALDLWRVLHTLAKRGNNAIKEPLEQFLADPQKGALGVTHYEGLEYSVRMVREVLETLAQSQPRSDDREERLKELIELSRVTQRWHSTSIRWLIQPGDEEAIAALPEMPIELLADIITHKVPDPSFVPLLIKAVQEQGCEERYLKALVACGAREQAIELARQELHRAPNEDDIHSFKRDIGNRRFIIRFLGAHGTSSESDLIKSFMDPSTVEPLHKASVRVYESEVARRNRESESRAVGTGPPRPNRETMVGEFRTAALMALARMGDRSVIPVYKEIYRGNDVRARVRAAVVLHYLGDNVAMELLGKFAEHDERSVPEITDSYMTFGVGADFQRAVGYLRSPETDALFLERVRRGLGDGDNDLLEDFAFFKDYEEELLPLMVSYLDSKDRRTRRYAYYALRAITGLDFDFDRRKPAGEQLEVVARWRAYVEKYLATRTAEEKGA